MKSPCCLLKVSEINKDFSKVFACGQRYSLLVGSAILILLLLSSMAYSTSAPPLSLEDCIQLILTGSNDLHMDRAVIGQKKALLNSAKKDRYPAVSVQFSSTHQTGPIPDYFPDNMFGYGLSIEQPIYRGKSIVSTIDLSEINLQIAELNAVKTINDLVYEVYISYFSLLRAEKLEDEKRQAVERLKAHLKDTKALFGVGIVPRNELLQSEVELAQGEQDLVDAQNRTANAHSQLNVAMLRDITAPLRIEDITPDDSVQFDWEDVRKKTLQTRPEISQGRLMVDFAEKNIILKEAAFLPDVSLQASYNSDVDYEMTGEEESSRWSRDNAMLKVTASWKLWTWLKDSDEKIAAKMERQKEKYNLARIIDDITLEARTAFLHIEQGAKRVVVSQKAIEQAEENYRINQNRYQRQIATSTDVLDAQELLTKAMTNYYDSLYGYELAKAALWRAQGKFGEEYTGRQRRQQAVVDQKKIYHIRINPLNTMHSQKMYLD